MRKGGHTDAKAAGTERRRYAAVGKSERCAAARIQLSGVRAAQHPLHDDAVGIAQAVWPAHHVDERRDDDHPAISRFAVSLSVHAFSARMKKRLHLQ